MAQHGIIYQVIEEQKQKDDLRKAQNFKVLTDFLKFRRDYLKEQEAKQRTIDITNDLYKQTFGTDIPEEYRKNPEVAKSYYDRQMKQFEAERLARKVGLKPEEIAGKPITAIYQLVEDKKRKDKELADRVKNRKAIESSIDKILLKHGISPVGKTLKEKSKALSELGLNKLRTYKLSPTDEKKVRYAAKHNLKFDISDLVDLDYRIKKYNDLLKQKEKLIQKYEYGTEQQDKAYQEKRKYFDKYFKQDENGNWYYDISQNPDEKEKFEKARKLATATEGGILGVGRKIKIFNRSPEEVAKNKAEFESRYKKIGNKYYRLVDNPEEEFSIPEGGGFTLDEILEKERQLENIDKQIRELQGTGDNSTIDIDTENENITPLENGKLKKNISNKWDKYLIQ